MMAYVNAKRNKDVVHIDSAGNHPITLTIQQAGKLYNELREILEEATVDKNISPSNNTEGLNPNITCS